MTQEDDMHQRSRNLHASTLKAWEEAGSRLAAEVVREIGELSAKACRTAKELHEWDEWANILLYGERYWQHSRFGIGMPSDKRSWLEARIEAPNK